MQMRTCDILRKDLSAQFSVKIMRTACLNVFDFKCIFQLVLIVFAILIFKNRGITGGLV